MMKHKDEWPSMKMRGEVPAEEFNQAAKVVLKVEVKSLIIDPARFSSFEKVVRILARVFCFIEILKKNRKKWKDFVEDSEMYLLKIAQCNLQTSFETGKLASLLPTLKTVKILGEEEKLIVTSGRLGGALVIGYDKTCLPILPYDSDISRLIMCDSHNIEHAGTDRTVWRSRTSVWIIKGRKLADKIRIKCFTCKVRAKTLQEQIMAPVSDNRLPPAPVFNTTAVDLFGPIEIKDTVKGRVKKKTWGVLFCCTVMSAIHIESAEDYSCDSFLLCLKRFMNMWATPQKIVSDPGSQLMAAAVELGSWDFSKIEEWVEGEKTEWHAIPADSQHFNGCVEAMIKVTKKQLADTLKSKVLTKGELDTLFSNVAFIVNSRPLMKKAGDDPLSGGPITPLHLMKGRCTKFVPTANLDHNPKLTKRLKFIEEMTDEFWRKWFVQVFHNLVPSYKWRRAARDVKVGDIVLVKDSNLMRGDYRRARVKEVFQGPDGKVRRVKLIYKRLNCDKESLKVKSSFTEIERAVQNLAVIVPVDWSDFNIEKEVTKGVKLCTL